MISALILITNYLYDYGKTDLTNVEYMQELNYISDIQNSLRSTATISCDGGSDEMLEKNLILANDTLHKQMLDMGIEFKIVGNLDSLNCPLSIPITFVMKSAEFEIENTFSL